MAKNRFSQIVFDSLGGVADGLSDVADAAQAKPGDRIRIYVTDGVIRSEVTGTERVNSEKQGPEEGAPAKNTENTHGE